MRVIFLAWMMILGCLAHAQEPRLWQQLLHDPPKLNQFMQNMPKGADLHLHASGAIETETLIQMARQHHYCVHPDFSLSESQAHCRDAAVLFRSKQARQQALEAWSMQNFVSSDPKIRAAHFFSSFPKIDIMMKAHWPEVIANVLKQADKQHILYLELMLSMQGEKPKARGQGDEERLDVAAFIQKNIEEFRQLKIKAKNLTSPRVKTDCAFILEIKRNQTFDQFKLDAFEVFSIANAVPEILGINLVQPEYAKYAYQDYQKQMRWLKQLKTRFPQKPLVLHAGEIPLNLSHGKLPGHIALAVQEVAPLRIGHGVSIINEPQATQTLQKMREHDIAVEINLTSNDEILGVKGKRHPLQTYLQHGVAVVLSSDDPGVSRNNLSHEYYRAVREHKLSFEQLMQVNRQSLHYSLLPGASLWQNVKTATPIQACRKLNSPRCLNFIANQPKARLEWQLEQDMQAFLTQTLGLTYA